MLEEVLSDVIIDEINHFLTRKWLTIMTIDKAREMIALQVDLGSGYNRNAVRLILAEIQREYGQDASDDLIREFSLNTVFGLEVGKKINP